MALFFRVFTGGGGVKAYENEGENKTNKKEKGRSGQYSTNFGASLVDSANRNPRTNR